MKQLLLLVTCILAATSINVSGPEHDNPHAFADFVYHNGHIITMDPSNENPNFVAVTNGKIVAVERQSSIIKQYIGPKTQIVNLEKKTLIPGLIDAHSHFSTTATHFAQGFNISPPPFGPVTSIPILLQVIKDYLAANNIPPGQPIYGSGYSELEMDEGRHPNRYELDSVSTVHPIVLTHFSIHSMTANSLALELTGYHNASSAPQGGLLDTFENGTVTGVCREHAIFPLYGRFGLTFAKLTPQQVINTAKEYFSSGVTTAQDLVLSRLEPSVYLKMGDAFPLDVNGYYLITSPNLTVFQDIMANYSNHRFTPRGGKFWLDGSIQGYTGLLSEPYFVPESKYHDDLSNYVYDTSRSCATEVCGNDNFPAPTLLRELFKTLLNSNIDIHVHCNGDKASDNMIQALQWARSNSHPNTTSRVAMIHAQTVREDQLDLMAELQIIPSFFPVHLYYWGDKHYHKYLGPTRANRMNPIGSAIRRNMTYTLHNDSPVVLAGVVNGINTFLKIVSCAVNRVTSSGRVLDDGTQKISAYDALKGVTINSAWQSHEQTTKGSITVGKVADFAVLNLNPLTIDPIELDKLVVLATVKGGRVVFGSFPESASIDEMR